MGQKGSAHCSIFGWKGHDEKKDISMLFSIVSFSGDEYEKN